MATFEQISDTALQYISARDAETQSLLSQTKNQLAATYTGIDTAVSLLTTLSNYLTGVQLPTFDYADATEDQPNQTLATIPEALTVNLNELADPTSPLQESYAQDVGSAALDAETLLATAPDPATDADLATAWTDYDENFGPITPPEQFEPVLDDVVGEDFSPAEVTFPELPQGAITPLVQIDAGDVPATPDPVTGLPSSLLQDLTNAIPDPLSSGLVDDLTGAVPAPLASGLVTDLANAAPAPLSADLVTTLSGAVPAALSSDLIAELTAAVPAPLPATATQAMSAKMPAPLTRPDVLISDEDWDRLYDRAAGDVARKEATETFQAQNLAAMRGVAVPPILMTLGANSAQHAALMELNRLRRDSAAEQAKAHREDSKTLFDTEVQAFESEVKVFDAEARLLDSNIKVFGTEVQVFDSAAKVFDSTARVFDSEVQVFDAAVKVFGSNVQVFDSKAKAFDAGARVFDSNVQVFDSELKVADFATKVFDSNARVFDSEARVFDANAKVFDSQVRAFDSQVRLFEVVAAEQRQRHAAMISEETERFRIEQQKAADELKVKQDLLLKEWELRVRLGFDSERARYEIRKLYNDMLVNNQTVVAEFNLKQWVANRERETAEYQVRTQVGVNRFSTRVEGATRLFATQREAVVAAYTAERNAVIEEFRAKYQVQVEQYKAQVGAILDRHRAFWDSHLRRETLKLEFDKTEFATALDKAKAEAEFDLRKNDMAVKVTLGQVVDATNIYAQLVTAFLSASDASLGTSASISLSGDA